MNPTHQTISTLLRYHVLLNQYRRRFIDYFMDVPQELEDINLDDVILDLIGFPADNTTEYSKHTNDDTAHIRTDIENLFCRDQWYTLGYDATEENIPHITRRLLSDYYTLRVQRPNLFEAA
ncbi:MAG TPA: hypothetical protein VK167_05520 [Flavipsychrobacter sp.]|nr:hypothetical protein [Flavipsychrobacter sp.]